MFLDIFSSNRHLRSKARAVYLSLVGQARQPVFYRDLGVPDTPEGRFEMIALHAFLVLHRFKARDGSAETAPEQLGQAVFDLMFADMDRNLREMGTGDLAVGRRVKSLAQGFYGLITAYENGLADEPGALVEALEKNLYGGTAPDGGAEAIDEYMRHSAALLAAAPLDVLTEGDLIFAEVPEKIQVSEQEL